MVKLFALLLTLNSFISIGQGYFGQKNLISVQGIGSIPLIYNGAKVISDISMTDAFRDPFIYIFSGDGGFSVSYSRILSQVSAIGFEYSLYQSSLLLPTQESFEYIENGVYQITYIRFLPERLALRTSTFMPKVEFNTFENQFPLGLNHQIGFGFTITKPQTEKFYTSPVDFYSGSSLDSASNYFDYAKVLDRNFKSLNGLSMMYHLNVRVPLNKHFLVNLGLRYTLNHTIKNNQNNSYIIPMSSNDYYFSSSEIENEISRKRFRSLLSFNVGINYCF